MYSLEAKEIVLMVTLEQPEEAGTVEELLEVQIVQHEEQLTFLNLMLLSLMLVTIY